MFSTTYIKLQFTMKIFGWRDMGDLPLQNPGILGDVVQLSANLRIY